MQTENISTTAEHSGLVEQGRLVSGLWAQSPVSQSLGMAAQVLCAGQQMFWQESPKPLEVL